MKSTFLWIPLVIFSMTTTMTACGDDDDNAQPQPQNIVDIAAGDPQFSTLVTALDRTGLDAVVRSLSEATVFAPTNDAFNALGVDLNSLSDEALSEILLYHVVGTGIASAELAEGQTYVSTAAAAGPNDTQLSLLVEKSAGNVTLNGEVSVVAADVDASNGVIHVIDAVLLPLDVVGHASANTNFTQLVSALGSASGNLVDVLQGDGPFTVFAPVDAAFEEISGVVATLSADQLAEVLTYHVVAGSNVLSGDLSNGQEVTTVNSGTFTVNIGSQAVTITDSQGNVANVILTDVQATNGVIHVLDKVILPQL